MEHVGSDRASQTMVIRLGLQELASVPPASHLDRQGEGSARDRKMLACGSHADTLWIT